MMNYGIRTGDGFGGMMKGWNWGDGAMMGYGTGLYSFFHLITWFLVICILVALLRWLWKKGDK